MADFLDQDEIDCLLDIVEDGEVVGAENIGIVTLQGTAQSELQDIVMGASGIVITEQRSFGNSQEVNHYTIIALDKKNGIAVLTDGHLNPKKVNVAELEGGFYKSRDRYEAIEVKKLFDTISKMLNEKVGIEFSDFLISVKSAKEVYPEVWL